MGNDVAPRLNTTSEIIASSRFGVAGTVTLNTLDIDPSRGLVNLPTDLIDVSNQIASGCAVGAELVATNKFIITGRGGLPPNPTETLNGEAVLTNWATLHSAENLSSSAPATNATKMPTQIVEAQGWALNSQHQVILTASTPTVTPNSPALTPTSCHRSSSFGVDVLPTD